MTPAIRTNGHSNGHPIRTEANEGHEEKSFEQTPSLPSLPSVKNLAIWNAVCETDPARTSRFEGRKGGFSGTAVNPTYKAKRATELFGPIGIGWGFDEVEHFIADGAGSDKVWFSKVRLWYLRNGERGEVEHWGATTFVGTNKNGPFTDEEAAKKSITDAVGKCLSLLGFSADVHLGLYDDQKYVNDRRQEEARKKSRQARSGGVSPPLADAQARRDAASFGPVTGEHLANPRGGATSHPHPEQRSEVRGQRPEAGGRSELAADLAAFSALAQAASSIADVKRAEHVLRSERLRAGHPLSDVESSLVAIWADTGCRRIKSEQRRAQRN